MAAKQKREFLQIWIDPDFKTTYEKFIMLARRHKRSVSSEAKILIEDAVKREIVVE